MSDWITDRPPKEGDKVLITHNYGKYYTVDSANVYIGANKKLWFEDTGYGDFGYGEWGENVIAWKPLPKPYEPND